MREYEFSLTRILPYSGIVYVLLLFICTRIVLPEQFLRKLFLIRLLFIKELFIVLFRHIISYKMFFLSRCKFIQCTYTYTTWEVSVFGVFLVPIFPHLEWIQRDTLYLSVFSPKNGPERLQIRTLFTHWYL